MKHIDQAAPIDIAVGAPAQDEVAQHVADCVVCRGEVAAYERTLHAVRADAPVTPAPDAVWAAIQREIAATEVITPVVSAAPGVSAAPVVPAAPVGSAAPVVPAGPGVSEPVSLASVRARRLPVRWLAAAAGFGVLVGGAGLQLINRVAEPTTTSVADVALATLDTGQERGIARLDRHEGQLDLRVDVEPLDAADGYLEVWLINSDLERMISLGVLPSEASERSFPASADLIARGYVIVDISKEAFDDQPTHSGESLLRGRLEV